jgi:hypothetical protein
MGEELYAAGLGWGFVSFDNIPNAWITLFQCVTLEGWSPIMYMVMDAYSHPAAATFFLIVIFCSAFLVMNLMLAVVVGKSRMSMRAGETSLTGLGAGDSGKGMTRARSASSQFLQPGLQGIRAAAVSTTFTTVSGSTGVVKGSMARAAVHERRPSLNVGAPLKVVTMHCTSLIIHCTIVLH